MKKRDVFVYEYLVDFNGKRSAIAAGYSKSSAEVTASRLLRDSRVKAEIDRRVKERCTRLEIKAEAVLAELAKIGFANMMDYLAINGSDASVDFSRLTREQAAAIQEVTSDVYLETTEGEGKLAVKRTKFKLADKTRSLELLGRHLKLFTEKVDLSGGLTFYNGITKPKGSPSVTNEPTAACSETVETGFASPSEQQRVDPEVPVVLFNGIMHRGN